MYEYLRKPWSAALIAAAVTVAFLYVKLNIIGNKKNVPNHTYLQPAALVAILVFVIVHYGGMHSEPILKTTVV